MKSFLAILRGPDHVFEFVDAAHRESFGDREIIGRARADVYPELNNQGFADAPRRAYATGETVFMRDRSARFATSLPGQPLQRRLDISYEPMRDAKGVISGLFVRGRDVTGLGDHPLEHRARDAGLETLNDAELLTLMLYHITQDADSADQAAHLLRRFGHLSGVLCGSLPSLSRIVPGVQDSSSRSLPSSVALHLKITREIGRRILFERVAAKPILSSSASLRGYLKALLGDEPREKFLVLFLGPSLRLIACETMSEGTVAHAPVYAREVIRRALELSATGLVLVHNHPSGSRRISASDIRTTMEIQRGGAVLDIAVIDHLIVAGDAIVSLADDGRMPVLKITDLPV